MKSLSDPPALPPRTRRSAAVNRVDIGDFVGGVGAENDWNSNAIKHGLLGRLGSYLKSPTSPKSTHTRLKFGAFRFWGILPFVGVRMHPVYFIQPRQLRELRDRNDEHAVALVRNQMEFPAHYVSDPRKSVTVALSFPTCVRPFRSDSPCATPRSAGDRRPPRVRRAAQFVVGRNSDQL